MSSITMSVGLLAGTDIKHAIQDAKNLCIKLDIAYVCFSFNQTEVSVGRNCNIEKSVKEWKEKFKDNKFGFVFN